MFSLTSRSCRIAVLALLLASSALPAEELQDPTRPSYYTAAPGAAPTEQSLVLSAIRIAPAQRSAVINGRSVRVGDTLGDARVLAINATGVRLRRGTDEFVLQLLPVKVKQAHKAAGR